MDRVKVDFTNNLETQMELINSLKKENYNTPVFEPKELVVAFSKIKEDVDKHIQSVVLFCKKRMVRDVIYLQGDYDKSRQRLKEMQQAVSLVSLVGQYFPPLPPIDLVSSSLIGLESLQRKLKRKKP